MEDIKVIFDKTLELVKECGEILKNVDHEKEATAKADGSLVTKYDLLLDKKLTEGLKQIANHPVLSEEHTEECNDTYFIIDPIDGTHNFNSGLEFFCIIIAFVKNGETLFSIIYAPLLSKMFTAIKGEGAFLNNKKISVRESGKKLVGVCDITKDTVNAIDNIVNCEKNIDLRSMYCTGLELSYIANGTLDFLFLKNSAFEWDFIGAKLILEEAGGVFKSMKLSTGGYGIIAGTKEAVDNIEKIIQIF